MTRLFVALDLPDTVKTQLKALRDDSLHGARWTKPEQWHLTLHFIGETGDADRINTALQTVTAVPFTLDLKGVGTFPQRGKPRVLWAGVDAPDALQQLHEAIGDALKTTGFVLETRPYHPHLTLARFKHDVPSRAAMDAYRARHASFRSDPVTVTQFTLYRSELHRSGAVYTELHRYHLNSQ